MVKLLTKNQIFCLIKEKNMLVTDKELKSIVSDTRNLNIGRNYWQSGYVKKIK